MSLLLSWEEIAKIISFEFYFEFLVLCPWWVAIVKIQKSTVDAGI